MYLTFTLIDRFINMKFENFELNLSGNYLLLIISIVVSILFSFYIYRNAIPKLNTILKWILISLRSLAIALILFIIFEPLINISWVFKQKPALAILIDNSASMSLQDNNISRSEVEKDIISKIKNMNNHKDNRLLYFTFADKLNQFKSNELDSIQFKEDGTNFYNALQEINNIISEEFIQSVVLISDGNHNIGINPINITESYNIPIHTIGVGDKKEKKDILITNVMTNRVAYANTEVPVTINYRSTGFTNRRVEISLVQGDTLRDSKQVVLDSSSLEQKINLSYIARKSGEQKFTVQITKLKDEFTTKNNTRNFYTNILKSKLKILIASGAPSFDNSFIKQILDSDENFEITSITLKTASEFYPHDFDLSKNQLAEFDCFVFLDFPREINNSMPLLEEMIDLIQNDGKPLLLFAGKNFSMNVIKEIQDYIPFTIRSYSQSSALTIISPTMTGTSDPILIGNNESEIDENIQKWRDIPPIYYPFNEISTHPGSQIFLVTDGGQSISGRGKRSLPVLLSQTLNRTKVMALLGHDFWRWHFMMKGVNEKDDLFSSFLERAVRWLVTRDDSKLVKIATNKSIYRSGETIYFNAEIYSQNYIPLDNAKLEVKISGNNFEDEIFLKNAGNGKYQGEYRLAGGGDYQYNMTATHKNRVLGNDNGKFTVEDFNLEFQKTNLNDILLQQLSFATNGKYFYHTQMDALSSELNNKNREIVKSNKIELWNKSIILFIIILLLSTEWFIRKRKGML